MMRTASILTLLLALTVATCYGEFHEPGHFKAVAGNSRFIACAGDGVAMRFDRLAKWAAVDSAFTGLPVGVSAMVQSGDETLMAAWRGSLTLLGEKRFGRLDNWHGLRFPPVLGLESTSDGVLFFTSDGWGMAHEKEGIRFYAAGGTASLGVGLAAATGGPKAAWLLDRYGKIWRHEPGEVPEEVPAPFFAADVTSDGQSLFALDNKGVVRKLEENGWVKAAGGFANASSGMHEGRRAFVDVGRIFSPVHGEVRASGGATAVGKFGDLSLELSGGDVRRSDGTALPKPGDCSPEPIALVPWRGGFVPLYPDGTTGDPEHRLDLPQAFLRELMPLNQGVFTDGSSIFLFLLNRVLSVPSEGVVPVAAFPSFNENGAFTGFAVLTAQGEMIELLSESRVTRAPEEFAKTLANTIPGLRRDEAGEISDLLKGALGEGIIPRAVIPVRSGDILPEQGLLVMGTDRIMLTSPNLFTPVSLSLPVGEGAWLGCFEYQGRFFAWSECALYQLSPQGLRECYRPGGGAAFRSVAPLGDILLVLLDCGLFSTVPGLSVTAEHLGEQIQLTTEFTGYNNRRGPSLTLVTTSGDQDLGIPSTATSHELPAAGAFMGFPGAESFTLKGKGVLLPFVRLPEPPDAPEAFERKLLAAGIEDALPVPADTPALLMAPDLVPSASTGGAFTDTDSISAIVNWQGARLELMPMHRAGKRTTLGLRCSPPVTPLGRGWAFIGRPYRVTVDGGDSPRLVRLVLGVPKALEHAWPDCDTLELSIALATPDGPAPLPTVTGEDGMLHAVIPPSVWKECASHSFAVALALPGSGRTEQLSHGSCSITAGENGGMALKLPDGPARRVAIWRGSEFLLGARTKPHASELTWNRSGSNAEEFHGPAFYEVPSEPLLVCMVSETADGPKTQYCVVSGTAPDAEASPRSRPVRKPRGPVTRYVLGKLSLWADADGTLATPAENDAATTDVAVWYAALIRKSGALLHPYLFGRQDDDRSR